MRRIALLVAFAIVLPAVERGFVPLRRAEGAFVALVIGNGAYPEAPLGNPVNDASDLATALEGIGFRVERLLDADKEQMALGIARFGELLPRAKAAVFYYAGHGVQVQGENWLLPIGRTPSTRISEEDQVPHRAISAGEVLAKMETAKVPMNLVILDACRNNPFKGAGRGRVLGLAELRGPVGSLILYSTAPGRVAEDGHGRNSPFTAALLQHLLRPGLDVRLLPSEITAAVADATGGVQVPWTSSSLSAGFCFVPELAPDEEQALKQAELASLQGEAAADAKVEAAAAATAKAVAAVAARRRQDEAARAAGQAELDRLGAQIEAMRKRRQDRGGGDDLDRMLAVVRQREAQQQELRAAQEAAAAARQAQEAEIARLRQQEYELARTRAAERRRLIGADLQKYREISGSAFGKDLAQAAWERVLGKWGLAGDGIAPGDEAALLAAAAPVPAAPAEKLEFREVLAEYPDRDFPSTTAGADDCAWVALGDGRYRPNPRLPAGDGEERIAAMAPEPGREPTRFFRLGPVRLSGKDIAKIDIIASGTGPELALTFADAVAERNRAFTSAMVGRLLAIVIDGVVRSAPVVNGAFSTRCSITGNFSQLEVEDLRRALLAAQARPVAP